MHATAWTILILFFTVASSCSTAPDDDSCVPADNGADAPGTLRLACDGSTVVDSCGEVVEACADFEVCFTSDVLFRETGVRDASCALPGGAGDRCPSEESDFPPCGDGLRCVPTDENDVSTCVP